MFGLKVYFISIEYLDYYEAVSFQCKPQVFFKGF